jgi:hypothetical protein
MEGDKVKRFWIGNATVVAVLALAGLSCEGPKAEKPALVPLATVYVPLTTAPPSTVATTVKVDEPGIPTPSWPPLVDPETPCQEWLPLAHQVGWPKDREINERLMWIMHRESRCNTDSFNGSDPNSGSRGLMQINGFWCQKWLQEQGILTVCEDLFDPRINLRAALAIFNYSVDKNNNGWHPWRV